MVKEGQRPEMVRARFDAQLGVDSWRTPGRQELPAPLVEPNAPWWWKGAEEASSSFLKAVGVKL